MISRRITFSALFILILVASLFAGLTSCSDVFLQKESADFALSFVAPGASSGRSADGAADWNVTAWLELEDGTRLQSQQTTAMAGEPVAIAFDSVAAGTRLKVKVELVSVTDPSLRYAGESELMEVLPGEKTVHLEPKLVGAEPEEDTPSPKPEEGEKEEPSIVNAATPTIATQPEGETKTFAAGQATAVKKELTVKASVSDGGVLSYRWYSNNTNSTEGGTAIEGATSSSYEAAVNAKETKYFYCVITNTNNSVTGAKTAATITSVVAVASVEGELTRITAKYTGSQGYMLVGQINHNDFTVTETYTSGTDRVDVTVTPNENSYTIGATNGDSAEAIGQVPYTVTRIGTNVTTSAVVLTKYELNESFLAIAGAGTVTQNGNLVLTAQYKTVDGADVEYKLYYGSGSSNTYKVIENVSIFWTGDVQQSSTWEALADTATAGQKTATVKLISTDEWCVTTDGIEKSEEFKAEPSGELGSQTNPVTTWAELAEAVADSATSTIYVNVHTMTAESSSITFNGNKQIIPLQDLTITGTLSDSCLFDVRDYAVSLGSDAHTITLDGISTRETIISISGTLSMTNVSVENCSGGGYLVYQGAGATCLNNVSFSGNKPNDCIDLHSSDTENNTLEIGQDVAIGGIYIAVYDGAVAPPLVKLNAASSLRAGSSKITLTVQSSSPVGLQVVSVGDYAGDPNDLFEVVGNDGAIYTLDGEGRLVAADDSTGTTTPEGELSSITATYNGSTIFVGAPLSDSDFTVTENYSDGSTMQVSSIESLYVVVPADSNAIGNVPVSIKSRSNEDIQTQVIVPIKYELDVNNLTITGGDTVTQNGNLVLTAQYKTVDGADVEYKLYDGSSSSNTYKVIENVDIYWTGDVQQSNTWEALADTATAGQKTAIVKLISTDEWCVTTNGIEKPHLYTVNAATSGDSSGISDENSLRAAIDKADTGAVIVVENTFPIKNTIIIEKEIVLRGNGSNSLQRSTDTSDGDITGPMFEVKSSGNLTLESIILDGQYYDTFMAVENNPFLINLGITTLKNVTMQNIFMYQSANYNSITLNCGTIYSAGELSIVDSTIEEKITMNASDATNIFIASGSVSISNSTIYPAANPNGAEYNVLTMGADTNAFEAITYSINGITDGLTRVTQTSITPNSPPDKEVGEEVVE